ncbi:tetratricopeptide (TPR) repeat protein [Catenulispora sp. EB89]|uniref:tetratricopeptide repeat protein n=1 Tax=Catenulispora sp. EB89 TaxID=3156257 RepID=UPI003512D280
MNRTAELAALDQHAAESGPGIAVIAGGPGSGKTAIALQWAHDNRSQYADGQLFVNLRGYDPGPRPSTDQVLEMFLRALHVPAGQIPTDADAKAALYRSLLADRRMLVVLDNAADADQVRPLLPGTHGCTTVVTSRSRLAGLTAREGAARLDIMVLPENEAIALLRAAAGPERVDSEPGPVGELALLCGRLPLALRIAGDHLATHPFTTVADLVDELTEEGSRLEGLDGAEESVRSVFSWSYQALPEPWARAFRLLGLHVCHEIDTDAAAALFSTGLVEARRTLEGLAGLHLVEQVGRNRFGMHDLLRAYAAELAAADHDRAAIDAAADRLLSWFAYTVTNAAVHLPFRYLAALAAPPSQVVPKTFNDQESALRWCEQERANLASAVRTASSRGQYRLCHQLAMQLGGFYNLRKYWNDWTTTFTLAIGAAERDGDDAALAWLLTNLGIAYRDLRRFEESAAVLERALPLFAAAGDRVGRLSALNNLGSTLLEAGDAESARTRYEAAADGYEELGLHQSQGRSLSNLGTAFTALHRADDAITAIERGLVLLRQASDTHGTGFTLHNLGEAHLAVGNAAAAEEALRHALVIRVDTGNQWGEARTRLALGKALHAQGRANKAADELSRADDLFQEHGTPTDIAYVALASAQVHAALGDLATARKALFRATWLLGPADQELAGLLEAALNELGTA